MAAPTFQSVQDSGSYVSTPGTRTVTKPTSLAVGDLMIAYAIVASTHEPILSSGFTTLNDLGTIAVHPTRAKVGFKVAEASDVAATDFTFTDTGFASISRITGASPSSASVIVSGVAQLNSASYSQTGLTPKDYGDGVLLMQFFNFEGGSSGTIANYAIVTSNPSWTAGYNKPGASSDGVAMAYATRPEVTDTGNFSANGAGGAGADWLGQMIAIPVPLVSTTSETVTLTESVVRTTGVNISDTVSLIEGVTNTVERWANQAKNLVNWTNQDKHE